MTKPPFLPKEQPTTFVRSLGFAWAGLIHTVVHQRNMRLHIIAALLVGLVGSAIELGLAEKAILIFCVVLIFFAEMLNSALEQLVDLAIQEFDEKARLTKDIAAAGVLVLALGSMVIFAAILVHDADVIFRDVAVIERQVLFGVPLAFFGGALMHESHKPLALDAVFALGAFGTWALTTTWTESYVMSAMLFGLLVVCAAAAGARRQARRQAAKRQ
ncbi:MAG: diacylglycerol kinase family protein [Myxococcaceae bacterium]|nr:diacylglycerol kinase family protein [Myxococcaceae bacterium]MCA3012276.1 diacylglycerol kinase family protein [Myxococcaceae bacterium]